MKPSPVQPSARFSGRSDNIHSIAVVTRLLLDLPEERSDYRDNGHEDAETSKGDQHQESGRGECELLRVSSDRPVDTTSGHTAPTESEEQYRETVLASDDRLRCWNDHTYSDGHERTVVDMQSFHRGYQDISYERLY